MNPNDSDKSLRFDEKGLLPCVVQDWLDGTVLMVGYMNREALAQTSQTGVVHFWSRSRQQLWKKGETSGHELYVKRLLVDCDGDTLLVKAEPIGPTCHTGTRSCFFTELSSTHPPPVTDPTAGWGGIIERVYQTVLERKESPTTQSYVSTLLRGGVDRQLKKIAEEAGEVMLAAKNQDEKEIVYEMADLWFHSLVVLGHFGIPPLEVYRELGRRFGTSGLRKKEGIPHP